MEKRKYWERHVKGQERSGESIPEYCRQAGINEKSLSYWRGKLKRNFARVETESGGIEIELPGGARLRLSASVEADTLRQVLEAVNALGC
jgi:hypothetical protein